MERRRFIPSAEGLEGRRLLSHVAGHRAGPAPPAVVATPQPQGKQYRIDRLPTFLRSVQQGRFLPTGVVESIQDDLTALRGVLQRPARATTTAFNQEIRRRLSDASLGVDDVLALDHVFGQVLQSAGAPTAVRQALQAHMRELATFDAADVNPVALAANDYALVLQTALVVGRPIRPPSAPRLLPADDSSPRGDRATSVVQPRLIGAYDPGATIEVVDPQGQVLGTTVVGPNGRYTVSIARPLTVSTHVLGVRARVEGIASATSRTISLRIVPPAVPRNGLR